MFRKCSAVIWLLRFPTWCRNRQVSTIQLVQKAVEMPFVMQRQIPVIAKTHWNSGGDRDFVHEWGCRCASCLETARNNHPDRREGRGGLTGRDATTYTNGAKEGGDATGGVYCRDCYGVKRVPREHVSEQIAEWIMDVMVSQSSQTEPMMKVVQTVRDEPDTRSPEAQGENALQQERIVESDDGCWRLGGGQKSTDAKKGKQDKQEQTDWEETGRISKDMGRQSTKNKVDKKMTEETKNVDVMWKRDVRSTGRCRRTCKFIALWFTSASGNSLDSWQCYFLCTDKLLMSCSSWRQHQVVCASRFHAGYVWKSRFQSGGILLNERFLRRIFMWISLHETQNQHQILRVRTKNLVKICMTILAEKSETERVITYCSEMSVHPEKRHADIIRHVVIRATGMFPLNEISKNKFEPTLCWTP